MWLLVAYIPERRELSKIKVSSRSQMKTRSYDWSGSGEEFGCRLPRPLLLLTDQTNKSGQWSFIQRHVIIRQKSVFTSFCGRSGQCGRLTTLELGRWTLIDMQVSIVWRSWKVLNAKNTLWKNNRWLLIMEVFPIWFHWKSKWQTSKTLYLEWMCAIVGRQVHHCSCYCC